jgi:simple sugar transport system permease protein
MTETKLSLRGVAHRIGLPTLIIAVFWLFLLVVSVFIKIPVVVMLSDTLRRFGMNGVMVLAMVPAIQSGTGPNFALPVGLVCGLLAMATAYELGLTGWGWLTVAAVLATLIAAGAGYVYGKLMNAVKGSEMTIATYTGFSIAAIMSLVWLTLPFNNASMRWPLGAGLRETISLDNIGGAQILNNFLGFQLGENFFVPTGMLLVLFALCAFVWLFMRTKTGVAVSAGGANPMFAKAAGLNTDGTRVTANMLSTVLGALGIIVYAQCYGWFQLYSGPLLMAFPAVAAVLIGGATAQRARVSHVLIGTFLFQGLMTTAMPVANQLFAGTDLSEPLRAMVQNGVILYALTQVTKGGGKS